MRMDRGGSSLSLLQYGVVHLVTWSVEKLGWDERYFTSLHCYGVCVSVTVAAGRSISYHANLHEMAGKLSAYCVDFRAMRHY